MPAPGDRLLDTNIVVDYVRGKSGAEDRLEAIPSLHLSVITLGELYLGASKSAKPDRNLATVEEFVSLCAILPCDLESARNYAAVKLALQKQATPIPENDLWIAASALQHGLTLVTRDSHFASVEGLAVESW